MICIDQPMQLVKGFDTSLYAISKLIDKLIMFIDKRPNLINSIIKNLNRPHGIQPKLRLVILHGYNQQAEQLVQQIQSKMLSHVIDQSIFNEFVELAIIQNINPQQYQYYYAHMKAVLNSFNQMLSQKRPFFKQESTPYEWSLVLPPQQINLSNYKQTFYYAKQRTLQYASILGGVYLIQKKANQLDGIQTISFKKQLISKKRQQFLKKVLQTHVRDIQKKFYYWEDEKTDSLMDLADELFDDLTKEAVIMINKFSKIRSLRF